MRGGQARIVDPEPPVQRRYVNQTEMAIILGVSAQTLITWRKNHEITADFVSPSGRIVLYKVEEVLAQNKRQQMMKENQQ